MLLINIFKSNQLLYMLYLKPIIFSIATQNSQGQNGSINFIFFKLGDNAKIYNIQYGKS